MKSLKINKVIVIIAVVASITASGLTLIEDQGQPQKIVSEIVKSDPVGS
ncbi:hypothetical protein [Marininema halotolerans]|uniref:Phr family secreted Rap phosphatase inhibitor n=1 Tax=Marininema halotolerans TaxID=1155944 RepID=A0A1I6R122_9BACL|nr:hypothetical protein [Marininema halotolerans]SFS58364.1 hypothetical protein SAMN05444972_10412 [Marininema halotolerans]